MLRELLLAGHGEAWSHAHIKMQQVLAHQRAHLAETHVSAKRRGQRKMIHARTAQRPAATTQLVRATSYVGTFTVASRHTHFHIFAIKPHTEGAGTRRRMVILVTQ